MDLIIPQRYDIEAPRRRPRARLPVVKESSTGPSASVAPSRFSAAAAAPAPSIYGSATWAVFPLSEPRIEF